MPSGAKKRKAAKRKKEQEQQQLLGVHQPGPLSSLNGGPPHPIPGNDLREAEEEDMVSHEGKGSESGSDFASPMEQDNHQCHLEVDDDGEQAEATGKDKIENDPDGVIGVLKAINSMQNCGEKQPRESFSPEKTNQDVKEIEEFHVTAVEVKYIQSEKAEQVLVLVERPPPVEHKNWEAIGANHLVERPVSISEEVEQAGGSLVESCKLAENVVEALTSGKEERVLRLSDATAEETDQRFKNHHDMKRHEIAGVTEVAQSRLLKERTSWWSCCGLFDVITSFNR